MKLQKKEIYIPVSIKDELIPIDELKSVSFDNGESFSYEAYGRGFKANELGYSHWLKKQTSYTFTEEELRAFVDKVRADTIEGVYSEELKRHVHYNDNEYFNEIIKD